MTSAMGFEDMMLSMPKFVIEKKLSIKTMLHSLGMQDAFHPNAAFGRMSIKGDDKADIYINDIHTATYLSVDKDGTEAASATATEYTTRGGGSNIKHMYWSLKLAHYTINECNHRTGDLVGHRASYPPRTGVCSS
jgi:serine protease inhibitor